MLSQLCCAFWRFSSDYQAIIVVSKMPLFAYVTWRSWWRTVAEKTWWRGKREYETKTLRNDTNGKWRGGTVWLFSCLGLAHKKTVAQSAVICHLPSARNKVKNKSAVFLCHFVLSFFGAKLRNVKKSPVFLCHFQPFDTFVRDALVWWSCFCETHL